MKVFWSVLDHALPLVVVLSAIDRHCLEPAPAHGDDQRVEGLENSLVPAVFLHANSDVAHALLLGQNPTHYYGITGIKVFYELTRNT